MIRTSIGPNLAYRLRPTLAFPCLAALLLMLSATVLSSCRQTSDAIDVAPDSQLQQQALGAVSSAHTLATEAGLEVLRQGGNAFDASVAVAAVLTVVEPMNSNLLGGYGSLIVHEGATGRTRYLDNNGRFPGNTDSDFFRAAENRQDIMRTAKAVSTPGNLAGFELLWQELGSREWDALLEQAIVHAEAGVPVSRPLAGSIKANWPHLSPYTRGFYGHEDQPLAEGELLVQKDLATTLRTVAAEGGASLYGGDLGLALDQEMQKQDGFLRLADLENHRSEWLDPISIHYRGVEVVTAGPPSNSFASLLCLGLMSRFDNAASGHNSELTLHRFAEATKHAFWGRLAYAGGPEIDPPPLDEILSADYWDEQTALFGEQASTFVAPRVLADEGSETTHFVVADAAGNVVSATITLGQGFGSAVMVEGTGIWLNNSMAFSTYEPKGNPMDAIPGARKHSSKTPTLLLRDGRPWIALGTPGGHTIPQTTPQMVMNLIDFEMPLQEALDAPRVSFAEPNRLQVETTLPAEVRAALAARGHELDETSGLGLAHGVALSYHEDGGIQFVAAADSRGVGLGAVAQRDSE